MRRVVAGVLTVVAGCCVVAGWANPRGEVQAQQPGLPTMPASLPAVKPLVLSDGMIALSSDTADGRQQIAVIDTKTRAMSVYHIEHTTGVISLKSVRNIAADLMMDEYNTDSPFPREIRSMGPTTESPKR